MPDDPKAKQRERRAGSKDPGVLRPKSHDQLSRLPHAPGRR